MIYVIKSEDRDSHSFFETVYHMIQMIQSRSFPDFWSWNLSFSPDIVAFFLKHLIIIHIGKSDQISLTFRGHFVGWSHRVVLFFHFFVYITPSRKKIIKPDVHQVPRYMKGACY